MKVSLLRQISGIILVSGLGAAVSDAATIKLKSGRVLEGKITEKTAEYIKMDVNGQPMQIKFSFIDEESLPVIENYQAETVKAENQPSLSGTKEEEGARYWKMGEEAFAAKDYAKALEYLLKAQNDSPGDPEDVMFIAMAYENLGQFDESIAYYKKVLTLNSENETVLYGANYSLGTLLYWEKNQINEALPYLETAAQIRPEEYTPHAGLCRLYFLLQRFDEAIQQAEMAIAISPDKSYKPYFEMGMSYYAQKDYEKCIESFEAAKRFEIDNEKDKEITHRFLADAYGYQKKFKKAKENYEVSLPLLIKQGDTEKAKKIEKLITELGKLEKFRPEQYNHE